VFQLERDAIFRRAWLMVGRVEQLPRKGSYFTKSVDVVDSSVLLVRGMDDEVRAFHNVCRHRGNKLVWQDDPAKDVAGTCRQFTCKYHAWRYGLDGDLTFIQQEAEFFDLDKATFGLLPVHCETWAGFVFVSFAEQPEQTLAEFLGPLGERLGGYPFEQLTSSFSYRAEIKANWKLDIDAFQEFYHAPVLHASQSPDAFAHLSREAGFEGVHYELVGPHRMVTTSGLRPWAMPDTMLNPMEKITQSGLFGPWKPADLEVPETLNPPKIKAWGLDSYQFFPNFAVLAWSQGWVVTYHYWPTSFNSHTFEAHVYFPPATTARERLAQEMAAVTFKEYALQDSSTLEATQMMLESGAVTHFPLNDQEILCRHLHHVAGQWVDELVASR
jgi:phenylpropionate dioxygenase-like ring-hydroxylating dioxygenase large terminal subunit